MWTTQWMDKPLAVAVNALAAYRLTRLITRDSFPPVARVRDAVVDKLDARQDAKGDPTTHPLATLITCPWCAGFWVAAGVAVAATVAPRWWPAIAYPLAFSGVTGLLAEREAPDET